MLGCFYTQQTVGIWGSIMIFCGLFGATVTGIVLDQTKWFKQIGVFNLTLALVSMIWFVEVSQGHSVPWCYNLTCLLLLVLTGGNSREQPFSGGYSTMFVWFLWAGLLAGMYGAWC